MFISFTTRFVDNYDPDIPIHTYDFGVMCSVNYKEQSVP